MENLFSDKEISNKFDLKGSERNRLVDPSCQTGETVLMDENLIQSEVVVVDFLGEFLGFLCCFSVLEGASLHFESQSDHFARGHQSGLVVFGEERCHRLFTAGRAG
jgi:hypothetical protein